jgi:hypothetical protein
VAHSQYPLMHACPYVVQSMHSCPSSPHAWSSVIPYCAHVGPRQQLEAQFCALQTTIPLLLVLDVLLLDVLVLDA